MFYEILYHNNYIFQSFQTIRERQNRRTVLRHKLCLSGVHDGGDKLNDFILLGKLMIY